MIDLTGLYISYAVDLSTVAQKGHRYFSTIVCIFPAYYNLLKKHFDFFSSISTRVESISTRVESISWLLFLWVQFFNINQNI